MRKLWLALWLISASIPALAVLPIEPTTTLTSETGNNTSTAASFLAQTNGNAGAGNVSRLPIRNLLYPGATTKIYAHWMPWFGPSNHMNVGYDSADPAQIKKQVEDMISRGIDGAIVDWYGPFSTHHNNATLNLMHEAEVHPGFEFAVMEDVGSVRLAANPQQKLIDDLNYLNTTYAASAAYMRRNGRPVIFFFGLETLPTAINWDVVRASVQGNPLFIFRNSGAFSATQSNGGYAWLVPLTTVTPNYMSLGYLDNFYSIALNFPQLQSFGSGFKGFDDSLADWGHNRKILQFCGETWLASMTRAGRFYSSTRQLENLQLVTWNDYEEGTELESGVDNCFSLTASVQGSTLSWSISGSETTIDHYTVFISLDGENLMPLADLAPGNRSLNLGSLNLGPATYQLYVKAVGKPSIVNRMSNAVGFTVPNQPPVAALMVTPSSGTAPLTVAASTAGSSDPDGSLTSATINFGDSTVLSVVPGASANHVYNTPGSYTVTATLTDNLGASATATAAVTAVVPRVVTITSPGNSTTQTSPVQIVAQATTPHQFAALQIYVDGVKVHEQPTPDLNRALVLAPGERQITVKGWDNMGSFMSTVRITVPAYVSISVPQNRAIGIAPIKIVASAHSANPIAAMKVYVDDVAVYETTASRIDTYLKMTRGQRHVTVQAWETNGTVIRASVTVMVR